MTYAEFKTRYESLMAEMLSYGNMPESWCVCQLLGELVDRYPSYEFRYETDGGNKYAG